jgi:hypothetical protein
MVERDFVMTIPLTQEERQQIEDSARRHGYETSVEYVRALLEFAAQQPEFDFETKEGLLAALRESWHQAMRGNTRPISELLK